MPTTEEILTGAKSKRSEVDTKPGTFILDGETLGKQMGRLQKAAAAIAKTWSGSQKKYEEHIRGMATEMLQHALENIKVKHISKDNGSGDDDGSGVGDGTR